MLRNYTTYVMLLLRKTIAFEFSASWSSPISYMNTILAHRPEVMMWVDSYKETWHSPIKHIHYFGIDSALFYITGDTLHILQFLTLVIEFSYQFRLK